MKKFILHKEHIFIFIYLSVTFLLYGCSKEPSDNYPKLSSVTVESYPLKDFKKDVFIGYDDEFNNDYLAAPHNIAIGNSDEIIVFDRNNVCIFIFDSNKNLLRKFGQHGQGPGDFSYDNEVAVGPEGDIYVLEKSNFRMSIFSKEGKYKNSFRIKSLYNYSSFSVSSDKKIIMNNPSCEYYFSIYSDTGELLQNLGEITIFSPQNWQVNANFAIGHTYYDTKKEVYYIFLQNIPSIKIFDKHGTLIRDFNTRAFPEINESPGLKPGVDHGSKIYQPSFFPSISVQDSIFYVAVKNLIGLDPGGDLQRFSIYIMDNDLNIISRLLVHERKIEPQPGGRGETVIFDLRFGVSKNGDIIYITDRYTAEIFAYHVER